MQFILYLIFLFFTGLFSFMPFWLLYRLSDLLFLLLFYVFRYRKKVVIKNLENAFPQKNTKEIFYIARGFYHNLCDILLEGIKGFSISKRTIVKRYKILNPEILLANYNKGESVIALAGHCSNWEWGAFAGGLQTIHTNIAFYKPLSNRYIDNFMQRIRAKCKTKLVSIYTTARTFKDYKNTLCVYLMIADQSPSNVQKAYWVNFLHQDTACLHGPEKYACLYNLPLYFLDIRRVKRGYYEVEILKLIDNPNDYKEGQITEKYMQILESVIRRSPENWLWSHRRWKKKRINSPLCTSNQ